jgi:hypothetical protein
MQTIFSYFLPTGIMRKMTGNNNPVIEKQDHPKEKTC